MDTLALVDLLLELQTAHAVAERIVLRVRRPGADADEPVWLVHGGADYPGDFHALWGSATPRDAPTRWLHPAFTTLDAALTALYGPDAAPHACHFCSYYFAVLPAAAQCQDVCARGEAFVVLREGAIVSRARSIRANERAAEVLVETCPEFRRRGYGRQTCCAWARQQMAQGRVAFYTHAAGNLASAALARSLRVVHLADGVWCYE